MKNTYRFTLLSFLCLTSFPYVLVAQTNWKKVSQPTVEQLAEHFNSPSPEYGPTVTWGWEGKIDSVTINHNLDCLRTYGFRMVTIEAGYNLPYPYLSTGYFKLIKYAVSAAKKRGMRVWFIDESKYPSGFAGGLFSQKRPDLRMQALVPIRILIKAGQTIDKRVPPFVMSAVVYNAASNQFIPVRAGKIHWTAPKDQGDWTLLMAEHAFKTSPTRASNNPSGVKDTTNSLCDYLNPKAAMQFIQFTHEQYKKYIGDEFGKTVIGFRSDEPAFSYTPWTPDMLKEFRKRKGYDIQSYLASFFLHNPTEKEQLAKADYWEVFSDLFRDNFFNVISKWCLKNNLEYEDHIDHDGPEDTRTMMALVRSEGDYFKDMRYLQIPGIDVIWNQIWPGNAANFPKLASSAAHLFGRSQVFSESFAAFHPQPNIKQLKWVLNEQLVRGINLFEIMYYPSSGRRGSSYNFMASDSFPSAMHVLNREAYLLANGQPTAKIGLYFPTSSLWLGDTLASGSVWHIARELSNHQMDFDFVDQQSIDSIMTLDNGRFTNLSGQSYSTIIIPSIKVISEAELRRLHIFAEEGGRVIFMGTAPTYIETTSFLKATGFTSVNWAIEEPTGELTQKVLNALPAPDVVFSKPCPSIKYIHRHLKDGDVYFFFNESDKRIIRSLSLSSCGKIQIWDPTNGDIQLVNRTCINKKYTKTSLNMMPFETKIIVLKSHQ